ncbi:MAG: hypothetical protein KZQ58_02245 [gamma proteobacterium symbiont of Bathyaustriella thionipta]|nr:hypothetical protein [gamma proteobacterium symbiont of Bathyaustriella thionipta]
MSSCSVNPDSRLPVLHVRFLGRGEDAMRMEKRLNCAGRALGVKVKIDWQPSRHGELVVYVGDKILIDHLVQTTELEIMLKSFIEHTISES